MPRPESSPSHEAGTESSAVAVQNCGRWLDWAATQVEVCLADDKPACEQLLESLTEALGSGAGSPVDVSACQKLSAVVVAVQAHDRLIQRLTHVAEALRGVQHHLADDAQARSAQSWRMLQQMQLERFSMSEERALFFRVVAQSQAADSHPGFGFEDGVELFTGDGRQP
jgi:predicted secreted protein